MTGMKLYSGPLSMYGAKAEIAALEKGIAIEVVMVPFEMKTLYQPKHPEVARINPKQQVPVLVDHDLEIFDSTQIFEYFETIKPDPALWPVDLKAKARARLLEHLSDEVFFPPIVRLMGLQATPDDPAAVEARATAMAFYDQMERDLGDKPFLVGDYSYADIAFWMAQVFAARMTAPMAERHGRLETWRDRVAARPAVTKVAGAMGRYMVSRNRPLPPFLQKLLA
jgi:glutathione S-transferase